MTATHYLVKALDYYPYNMEECMEALNYALSYDENNAVALCLMGRIQEEIFGNTALAIDYFEGALASDLGYAETYRHYMNVLIDHEQLDKAKAFLRFTKKNHPHLKAALLLSEARILEREHQWKKALKVLSKAIENAYSSDMMDEIETIKSRVELKMQKSKR